MRSSIPGLKRIPVDLDEFLNFVCPDPGLKQVIDKFQKLAENRGEFLYFVGGVVRDFVLFKKGELKDLPKEKDIDIVLEGDTKEFVKELLQMISGKVLFSTKFLTYKLKINTFNTSFYVIDLVTARKEKYPDVAVLPEVEPGTFEDDIKRRDFTINTLAVGLTSPFKGYLLDLLNGLKDLDRKLVVPIHRNSFVDDPTRIFRGIRYKVRLGFDFSKTFFEALERANAKKSIERLSASRIFNELNLFVHKEKETLWKDLFVSLEELGILKVLGLKFRKDVESVCKEFIEIKSKVKEKYQTKALLLGLIEGEVTDRLKRIGFLEKEVKRIEKSFYLLKAVEEAAPREKVETFERIEDWILFGAMFHLPKLKEEVIRYFKVYKNINLSLNGEDLKSLGIKEGRLIGKALKELKLAYYLGEISTPEEEKVWLKNRGFLP